MAYSLPPREEKARYVRGKFDEIARAYDRFNDLITFGQHRWWKRVVVGRLEIDPGDWGLDLCCGTADIALRTLPRVSGGGGVVAADFSHNMLRLARQRLAGAAPHTWAVLEADAMRLPFPDGRFRFITIGYGLRNVSDLRGCLAELRRVLRPGGLLISLDMGKVRPAWLRPLFDAYFFHVVPRIGQLLQPGQDMFAYLPHSTRDYPEQHALMAVMQEAGFTPEDLREYGFGATAIHIVRKPA